MHPKRSSVAKIAHNSRMPKQNHDLLFSPCTMTIDHTHPALDGVSEASMHATLHKTSELLHFALSEEAPHHACVGMGYKRKGMKH